MMKGKKGQSVLPLTIGFIVFNVFVYLLISALATDGVYAGSSNNPEGFSVNESVGAGDDLSWNDMSGIRKFFVTVWNMPWWVNLFIGLINAVIGTLLILAWIRGV